MMTGVNRRVASIAVLVALAAGLVACGDSEVDQRKAFIAFLQTRILDKPGVHIPRPNDDDIKSFGPYAAHYAVIVEFVSNSDLAAMGKKLNDSLPKLSSARDLIDRRAEIRAAGKQIGEVFNDADRKLAETTKAHEALKQPDDLKVVYDKAFDKVITKPMQGFHDTVPLALEIVTAAADLGDYMYGHRDKIKIIGTVPQAADARTQGEVNALAAKLNAHGARFGEAQKRLRVILEGS
jgi:hypothetical protein